MPYKAKGKCVYKKDTGKKVGCTKGSVDRYLAALHANANESFALDEVKVPDDLYYHGSSHKISKFIDDFVGGKDATDQEGPGIYFTSSKNNANSYGYFVYSVKLHPKKIVSTKDGKNAPAKQIEWLIKQAPEWESNAQNWHENPNVGLRLAIKDIFEYNRNPHQQFLQVWIDFYRYHPTEYVRNMVKLGYDAVLITGLESMITGESAISHMIVLNPAIIEFVEMEDTTPEEERKLNEVRRVVRQTLMEHVDSDYKKWKRKNVTIRGIREMGKVNGSDAMLGVGLYSAALSNKDLPKSFVKDQGAVYYVVNGKPKNPLKFNTVNEWEIWRDNFIYNTLGYKNIRQFNDATTIENEIQKLGHDGVEIIGREIVNYRPEDVKYFKTEEELKQYYNSSTIEEGLPGKKDERPLGKSLAQQTSNSYVTIYRACPIEVNEFLDRDYVTLSKKFAIEHAENNHVYHESPFHVIQALVPTSLVYDAFNPGEYFYSGPNKKGKEIYVSLGPDEYEGYEG